MPRAPAVDIAVGGVYEHITIVGFTGETVGCNSAVIVDTTETVRCNSALIEEVVGGLPWRPEVDVAIGHSRAHCLPHWGC